jgi:uncharacterized protein (TIGR00255 family)
MKSMTGFGRGAASDARFSVTIELKTVNNRFLDVHLRVGAEMASLENLIRKRIGERLSRGRVDVFLSIERTENVEYEINRPLIGGFLAAMRAMKDEFALAGEPDINVLARIPGAIQTAQSARSNANGASSEKADELTAVTMQALDAALDELDAMRAREGEALAAEMRAHLSEIERQVPVIESATGELVEAYRARLQKRIAELLARDGFDTIELDQARLAQEVAYLADRSDISEEIARLKSHVAQFYEIINSDGEVGKRLDFLLQELNREANTTLSKSTDLSIKEAGLAIKSSIEKLREQVQNAE